ncbi:MAG: GYF domain-containing protein [Bdellovibrionales bacterium]
MQEQFNISKNGENQGPFSLNEVVAMLKEKQLDPTDFVFNDVEQDWQMLMEMTQIMSAYKAANKPKIPAPSKKTTPKAESKPSEQGFSENVEPRKDATETNYSLNTQESSLKTLTGDGNWYILKNGERFGPFETTAIVQLMQSNQLQSFDYIWKQGFSDWARLTEIDDFQESSIKKLFSDEKSISNFQIRKHSRKSYKSEVIVHDNHRMWLGDCYQIGTGGAGISMKNAMLKPGQELWLHFKGGNYQPAFNVKAKIVSKKFIGKVNSMSTKIPYGLEFMSTDEDLKRKLNQIVNNL